MEHIGLTYYVQDICETLGDISAHIGADDLKLIGVYALGHRYAKWSGGLTLGMDDVELRSTTWEELLPKGAGVYDVDIIADRYFKIVKGKRTFVNDKSGQKPLEIVLALPHEKYEVAVSYKEEKEAETSKACL